MSKRWAEWTRQRERRKGIRVALRRRGYTMAKPAPIRGHQQPMYLFTFDGERFPVGILEL